MSSRDERLTERFLRWAHRGQGMDVWEEPVSPEPAFAPYPGHFLAPEPLDDGRRPTLFSAIVRDVSTRLADEERFAEQAEEISDPSPRSLARTELAELQMYFPDSLSFRRDAYHCLFVSLFGCREPISFELLAAHDGIAAQFAVHPSDAAIVRAQLDAFLPETTVVAKSGELLRSFSEATGEMVGVVEFGLEREFMVPLVAGKLDPFIGLIGALGEVAHGEFALFQVIFEPVRHPWAESAMRSVSDSAGGAFFVNAPELLSGTARKVASPFYAAVVRVLVRAGDARRVEEIIGNVGTALRAYSGQEQNGLVPVVEGEYPFEAHVCDALARQTRRSGMILNAEELSGFVHLPSSDVRSRRLRRQDAATKAAPAIVTADEGLLIGYNTHAGRSLSVTLSADQRVRHMHVIGASGTGKSTLLYNLIKQDIDNGAGVAVLDPHGDLIDRILGSIPEERIHDVVLLDPSDTDYPVGFNILHAHSELEKTLLASDLVSVFQRLSTSWGDQMGSVLSQAVLAFLESDKGGSLLDLRRFLIEPSFRASFLESVRDPEVIFYWKKAFPQLSGNKSLGPILTRLETFLSPKSIRYMVSQKSNRLDFSRILDSRTIFLAKLSQGAIGKENSYLLGTLLVSKLQQLAMARQSQAESARRDFIIYIDEFHNFITPSMAEILSGARKYRLGLVLGHQELRQLERDREVASAVLSNAYTRICFRVGDQDARTLEGGFADFTGKDLQRLGTGQAICRVERSDYDFNISVPLPQYPDEADADARRREVVAASREKYGSARSEVEAELAKANAAQPPEETVRPARNVPEAPAVKSQEPSPEKPATVAIRIPAAQRDQEAAKEPSSAGRGGKQHKYIQHLIKQWAEGMGWRTTIEAPVPGGPGSVDVLLAKSGLTIACEITVTTSIGHELENLKKCLSGGFNFVVSVCADEKRASEIESAMCFALPASARDRLRFLTPEGLFALVAEQDVKQASKETTVKGYKVKVSYRPLAPSDSAARIDSVTKVIAKSLKRLRQQSE